ncbi:(d)CMP kinase [candidate division KSB1 bacterium]|nr:(d)CMP kinase [candidate division KSB1 bacterium]
MISIDGPAGSGKSTTAKLVAKKLGFTFLDTGAMYRALTLKALRNNINLKNEKEVVSLTKDTDIKLFENRGWLRIVLDGEDVSKKIRTENISQNVATIAAFPAIRKWMVQLQRKIGKNENIVAEGRDIGTVVFPDARLKIFLVASLEARARRRVRDFTTTGEPADLNKIIKSIEQRDATDSKRKTSPLKKADDALEIDTTNLTIEQQVDIIVEKWGEVLKPNSNHKLTDKLTEDTEVN